jgi:hypothetical protein
VVTENVQVLRGTVVFVLAFVATWIVVLAIGRDSDERSADNFIAFLFAPFIALVVAALAAFLTVRLRQKP